MVNYYVELALDRSLSCDELKNELNKLRRKWQTRAYAGLTLVSRLKAEQMVEVIQEASAILLVEKKRLKYDSELDKIYNYIVGSISSQADKNVDSSSRQTVHMVDFYQELGLDRNHTQGALKAELDNLRHKWLSRSRYGSTNEQREKASRMVNIVRQVSRILLTDTERAQYDTALNACITSPELPCANRSNACIHIDSLEEALKEWQRRTSQYLSVKTTR